jgi:hypothetical protein
VVDWLSFSLRVWNRRGYPIRPADFLNQLTIAPGDPAIVEDGPGNLRIRLLEVTIEDFAHIDVQTDAGARSEAFTVGVRDGLLRAAEWLARQPTNVFADLRAAGWVTDLFIGGWVNQDQFDLDLPPEFLRSCGVLGLTVSICTND